MYILKKDTITYNGVPCIAENTAVFATEEYQSLDLLSAQLMRLDSRLPFDIQKVTKAVYTPAHGQSISSQSSEEAIAMAQKVAGWIVRPYNNENPNTGGGQTYVFTLADQTTCTIGENGIVFINGEPRYYFINESDGSQNGDAN